MRSFALGLALASALAACVTRQAVTPQAPTAPAAPAVSPAAPAVAAPAAPSAPRPTGPAPDRSLGAAGYAELGFPAADRTWTPTDYPAARDVLESLAGRDHGLLPRRESPASGSTYARLTDRGAFAMLGDRSLPAQTRLQVALQGLQGVNGIVKTYLAAHTAGRGTFHPELLDVQLLSLHAMRRMLDVAAELPAPVDGDPGADRFRTGMAQMKAGFALGVQGCMTSLGEPYPPTDRLRFASGLLEEFPACLGHLSEQGRAELRGAIRRALTREQDAAVKEQLSALERRLSGDTTRG